MKHEKQAKHEKLQRVLRAGFRAGDRTGGAAPQAQDPAATSSAAGKE